jgi:putative alpha-1,2-mannosidase
MYLNGEVYDKNYIMYDDLMKGAHLKFIMSDEPNKNRGTGRDAYPYSFSDME